MARKGTIRKERIVYDGKLAGYRLYSVGTGLYGADQFKGYEWLKKTKKKPKPKKR